MFLPDNVVVRRNMFVAQKNLYSNLWCCMYQNSTCFPDKNNSARNIKLISNQVSFTLLDKVVF